MNEADDYRFGPVLEPEPSEQDQPGSIGAMETPLQRDIVVEAVAEVGPKPALRAQSRTARDALTDKERAASSRRIVEKLLAHPDVLRAQTVLLYAHHASEVATDELAKELLKRGKAVAYPKMTTVPGLMTLWRVRGLDALVPHKHGIRAPDVTRATPIEPAVIDCVIYPGLAFTRGLARLGQGGGYYDRLSAKLGPHCVRIGVCHGVQMIDALPEDAHDVTMHWVVTEATVYPYVPDPPPPAVCAAAGMPLATIGGASGVTSTEDAPERASEPTDRQENP
ncbi:MAG: 5-formyltetrahydrofolate cyclo-ligase [Proteobacteria bacterium]|nr:5-formyltetrahydrofolate cyclo-ligase [Pseudomonadota bacterium]